MIEIIEIIIVKITLLIIFNVFTIFNVLLFLFLSHLKVILQKIYMNMYERISYMIIHVYEYLLCFVHIYTYFCMKKFLPELGIIYNYY